MSGARQKSGTSPSKKQKAAIQQGLRDSMHAIHDDITPGVIGTVCMQYGMLSQSYRC